MEIESRDPHHVVTTAALEGIRASLPDQQIVAGAADEGLSGSAAGQRVGASRTQMRDGAGKVAAEDDVALALPLPSSAFGIWRSDDQVGEAVPVHVARRGDRFAAVVALIHSDQSEAVGSIQRCEVE